MAEGMARAMSGLGLYYRALWEMLVAQGGYYELRRLCGAPRIPLWSTYGKEPPVMSEEDERRLFAAVWLHSIGLSLSLWSKPHYRAQSLRHDLADNFSNIAIPGTGLPLSWACCCKAVAVLYLCLLHPLVVLVQSLVVARSGEHRGDRDIGLIFWEELLAPRHWFALWRINSTVVAGHHYAHAAKPDVQAEYLFENKWHFLEEGLKQQKLGGGDMKVTPILGDVRELVCKHKNIEGGMGIHVFKNANAGGDWIIQEKLYNCKELEHLLPSGAPLSTFRVITMADPTAKTSEERHVPMTLVWRAGRAGKSTDHSSVLLPMDAETCQILEGKAFSNWYQVGRPGTGNLLSKQGITKHPDTGEVLAGKQVSCARTAIEMCVAAHRRLTPNVPAVGWDVGVAEGHGALLLEANLSCNFFGGRFDRQRFLRIIDTYYANGCTTGPSSTTETGGESAKKEK